MFAFGDKDGSLTDAKLQHLLGLAVFEPENLLFVADTYNHKLKKVDISKNAVTTLTGGGIDIVDGKTRELQEPGGLCVNKDGKKLYVADTNNHCIKVLELNKEFNVRNVHKLELDMSNLQTAKDKSKFQIANGNDLKISSSGGKLILQVHLNFTDSLKLTDGATQKWVVELPNAAWSAVPNCGSDINNIDVVVSVPSSKKSSKEAIDFIFNLLLCKEDTCLPKNVIVRQPVAYVDKGATEVNSDIQVSLNLATIVINK